MRAHGGLPSVSKGRLEAFSDGVIAVIITIMVLEFKPPHGTDLRALAELWPTFVAYVLSFVYVGIYWNNHHHMFQIARRIDGRTMWANLHLLFWLSLIPFATAWVGEAPNAAIPLALYGTLLLLCALAYSLLARSLVACDDPDSPLARAFGADWKGKSSIVAYVAGTVAAFWIPALAHVAYYGVAAMWFVPDRRVERVFVEDGPSNAGEAEAASG